MKKTTKILIVGAPRSGTTLIAGLLSNGNEASPMLPECSYITQIIIHYYNFLHYSDPQRFAAYAIDESILGTMYRGMVDSMLTTVESHFNKINYNHLILKDPELTPYLDLIPYFFGEDSKTVCVIRDPRAVIASMLQVERKKKRPLWLAWIKTPSWLTTYDFVSQVFREKRLISDFYSYYWRVQESELYKNKAMHIVRYEKIVLHDEGEFSQLEEYLGFPVGRVGFGKIHFDFDRADPTYSAGYGGAIQATSTDFEKILTRLQIKKIKTIFAGMNAIYGWWE